MIRQQQRSRLVGALVLLLLFGPSPSAAAAGAEDPSDEVLLRGLGLPTDGPGLLEFFRIRSTGTASSARLTALIEQLADDTPRARDQACAELLALGPLALPALRQAVKDPDMPRVAAAAERCLQALEHDSSHLTSAALRLLALRKPEGAGEAILQFLPLAEDESVLDEARSALGLVAFNRGKVDPALERYLEDKMPVRRGILLDVLCQQARDEPRALLRRLLQDQAPSVRVRAALALARGHDAEAIEILIDLMGQLPLAQGRQAEEFLGSLAGELGPRITLADDDISRKNCREAWQKWWKQPPAGQTAAALTEEVRKRTLSDPDRARMQNLVNDLGDDTFEVREKASSGLKALGPPVLPLLRAAARSTDPEVSQRSKGLLQEIDKGKTPPLDPAVPRLLAVRKAAGAAETLLKFLPFAEDESMSEGVQQALNALAARDGKPDPALLRALEDRTASRRAAAGEALCFNRDADTLPAVHKLLKDPEATVRLRVGLSLTQRRDRAAIPVLIALLDEVPEEEANSIEDYLRWLSTDRSPPELASAANAKKRREGWSAWWTGQGPRFEPPERPVALLPGRVLGYTLLVQSQNGQVSEVDQAGKVRWTISNLLTPMDAQVLPGDRVLVSEYGGMRVTERNLKGEIVWQKALASSPLNAQRLADGRTFIALRNQLLEVDRNGREAQSIARPMNDVMSAWKTRAGQIVLITSQAQCVRLDRTGRELKSFRVQGVSNFGNELLANGHILVPLAWQNRVTEYDAEGKIVWEATTALQPISAARLPNGNTLVACQQWPPHIVELDRKGKQVAEIKTTMYTARVRRR